MTVITNSKNCINISLYLRVSIYSVGFDHYCYFNYYLENLQLVTAAKILSHQLFSKHQQANKSEIKNDISKIPQLSTISKTDDNANNNNPATISQHSISYNNNMLSITS